MKTNERLRVVHVVEPPVAGVPQWVRLVADEQRAAGMDVEVLNKESGPLSGFDRHRIGSYPVTARRLQNYLEEFDPAVVHLHAFFSGLLGRALPSSIPVVYHPHSWPFDRDGFVAKRLGPVAERCLVGRTAAFVVVSDTEVESAAQHGIRGRFHEVGVPVEPRFFEIGPPPPRDRPLVVCVGRPSRQKGQDQILGIWDRVLGDVADLVLVGYSDTDRRLSPSVEAVAYGDPAPWIEKSRLLVAPSRWEGLSIACLEGLAAARPLVAFDIPSMRTFFRDGESPGALVPAFDAEALLLEIRALLADDVALARSAGSAVRVAGRYRPDHVAESVASMYEELGLFMEDE